MSEWTAAWCRWSVLAGPTTNRAIYHMDRRTLDCGGCWAPWRSELNGGGDRESDSGECTFKVTEDDDDDDVRMST